MFINLFVQWKELLNHRKKDFLPSTNNKKSFLLPNKLLIMRNKRPETRNNSRKEKLRKNRRDHRH